MTRRAIDRLLQGDDTLGVVPLLAAKVMQDLAQKQRASTPAPVAQVVVVPSAPSPSTDGWLVGAVALVSLGLGAGAGYMLARHG